MGSDQPQFREVQAENKSPERPFALLQEALYAGIGIGLLAQNTTPEIKSYETLRQERMLPKDMPAAGGMPGKRLYNPANPPEPLYDINKIDKNDIRLISPGKYMWRTTGAVPGFKDAEAQVSWYWKPDGSGVSGNITDPVNLEVTQVQTIYPSGISNSFIAGNAAVGLKVRKDTRKPTHNPDRPGIDCELTSHPIKATNGDYLVYTTKAFVGLGGQVEKKTIEKVDGKDYDYFYRTRVTRYEKLDADGKTPVGLLKNTIYRDEDGGTKQKLQETSYTNGKPDSTIIFDVNAPVQTKSKTITHEQYNGATMISRIVEHNCLAPRCELTIDYDKEDKQWVTQTYKNADGTIASLFERNLQDRTTLTLTLNNTLDIGPDGKLGSGKVIFKLGNDVQYYIDYLEVKEGDYLQTKEGDRKIVELKPPAGQLKFKYNADDQIIGVEGAEFFENNGSPIDAKKLEKMFIENTQINGLWQNALTHPKS